MNSNAIAMDAINPNKNHEEIPGNSSTATSSAKNSMIGLMENRFERYQKKTCNFGFIIAQYISMMPAEEDNEELRTWRVNSWKNRIAPEGYAFPGDPLNRKQLNYETAELTELGEKLLGSKNWD